MTSFPKRNPTNTSDDTAKGQIRQGNEALILEAAERVFAGAGFGGATMAAIAESSGLPKANLHYYFGSKQELYRAVLARTLQDWLAPTLGIVPEADPRTAIERYIRDKMLAEAKTVYMAEDGRVAQNGERHARERREEGG